MSCNSITLAARPKSSPRQTLLLLFREQYEYDKAQRQEDLSDLERRRLAAEAVKEAAKEEQFHLKQSIDRAKKRIDEARAQPLDELLRGLHLQVRSKPVTLRQAPGQAANGDNALRCPMSALHPLVCRIQLPSEQTAAALEQPMVMRGAANASLTNTHAHCAQSPDARGVKGADVAQASHPLEDAAWRPYHVFETMRLEEAQELLDQAAIFKVRSNAQSACCLQVVMSSRVRWFMRERRSSTSAISNRSCIAHVLLGRT